MTDEQRRHIDIESTKVFPFKKGHGRDSCMQREGFRVGAEYGLSLSENRVKELREAVANYICSEGCSCCRDTEAHERHEKRIAELLEVDMYEDGSGYDFGKYKNNY